MDLFQQLLFVKHEIVGIIDSLFQHFPSKGMKNVGIHEALFQHFPSENKKMLEYTKACSNISPQKV